MPKDYTYEEEQELLWSTFDDLWPVKEEHHQTSLPNEVEKFMIDKIKDALIECNYNRTHTAKKLGIKRETLLAKLKKFQLL